MYFNETDVLRAAFRTLQDAYEWAFDAEGAEFANYCMGVLDLVNELTKEEIREDTDKSDDAPAYA